MNLMKECLKGEFYMDTKRLYKSASNRMLCGVCGGVGEYINIDPTVIRLLWVIISFGGVGILAYIIAAILIPDR